MSHGQSYSDRMPRAPTFIELTKVASTDSARAAPADPASYVPGKASKESLPLEHSIKGWLRSPPTVGKSLVIDRTERNGVPVIGLFVSSAVVTFDAERIQTVNSVYRWKPCPPTAAVPRPRLPQAD
jgi:hypothetical protein